LKQVFCDDKIVQAIVARFYEEVWQQGFDSGKSSAYLGKYGHNGSDELMFKSVENPYKIKEG